MRIGEPLSNVDVIVFALGDLGGATSQVSHERLAHRAFELAPGRFSWTLPEFRQFPDKDIARVALVDASRDRGGSLVTGSVKAGYWRLTPAGAKWLAVNSERIALALGHSAPKAAGRPRDVDRIIAKTRQHPVFQEWVAGRLDDVPAEAFADLLGCSPDASPKVVSSRLGVLQSVAEAAGDVELNAMLAALQSRFSSMIVGG